MKRKILNKIDKKIPDFNLKIEKLFSNKSIIVNHNNLQNTWIKKVKEYIHLNY